MVELNEKAEEVVFCPNCGWNSAMDGEALPAPDDRLKPVEGLRDNGEPLVRLSDALAVIQCKADQVDRLTRERDDAKAAFRIEQIKHGETIRNKAVARDIDLKSSSILKYLEETRMWSASAFVAGETVPDPEQDMVDLYSFLCRLGNVLDAWAEDFDALQEWNISLAARTEAADQQVQKLTAENERLEANIVRLTSNPADHRYWEGRYRDEAAESVRLREVIQNALAAGLPDVVARAASSALQTQEGEE
ncbi:hypothetical protein ACFOOL_16340 [Devosia honganensis]|uniref:Uncharacterized protein n=1 Tax=Devosia honganensis TaxID=1610527 RepID=A0ABV7X436_9HYPH